MKTNNFFAVTIAIAMTAAGMISCNGSTAEQNKAPEGTPMGKIFVADKTAEDGSTCKVIADSTGYDITGNKWKKIEDKKDFLVGEDLEGGIALINLKGFSFSHVDSFEVKQVYAVNEMPSNEKYIKAYIHSGNKVAFSLSERIRSLCQVEGLEEDVLPLANGMLLYKQKGLWGIAKYDTEEAIMNAECQEIIVVNVKDTVYYLIKTADWSGYLDATGKDIKALTPAQFKAAKKAGKQIWSEGSVSAMTAKNI